MARGSAEQTLARGALPAAAALLVAAALVGCNPARPAAAPAPAPRRTDRVGERAAARPPAAAPRSEPVIPRAALDRILDAGPGAFLARLEIEPRLRHGRFTGWVIVRFFPGDPRFRAADLRPGDVVTAVNGHRIERPEDLFAVWTRLRTAAAIVVSGRRDGVPFTRRFAIAGPPAAGRAHGAGP